MTHNVERCVSSARRYRLDESGVGDKYDVDRDGDIHGGPALEFGLKGLVPPSGMPPLRKSIKE